MSQWLPNLNSKQRRNSRRPEKKVYILDAKGKQTSAFVTKSFKIAEIAPETIINGAKQGTDYTVSTDDTVRFVESPK